jgi:hypothetical protein
VKRRGEIHLHARRALRWAAVEPVKWQKGAGGTTKWSTAAAGIDECRE